jgi:hypothetical protein
LERHHQRDDAFVGEVDLIDGIIDLEQNSLLWQFDMLEMRTQQRRLLFRKACE